MDIYTNYDPNNITDLCLIMKKYNSDKSKLAYNGHHNYTIYYKFLFEPVRYNKMRIFELGLGTNNVNLPSNMGSNGTPGASLRGWSEFFPKSDIYGADIDKDILFNDSINRIKTYYCNQLDSDTIKQMWNITDLIEDFDIIIEDGLHNFEANKCFFENSIHKLKVNGVYIIEDVVISKIPIYHEWLTTWKNNNNNFDFNIIIIEGANNRYDNNLIAIKRKS